jgi:hypothetical protein
VGSGKRGGVMSILKKTDDEIRDMDKEELIEIVLAVRGLLSPEHFDDVKVDRPFHVYPYIIGEISATVGYGC